MKGLGVVLDTNCLISALIFSSGRMSWLRVNWQRGVIVPVVCGETVRELMRVLAYPKFRLEKEEIESLLGEFLPWARMVKLSVPADELEFLRDRDDAVFIHLARQAGAAFLVSGDRHLLELKGLVPDVIILSPGELQNELR
ncbi:MAG: putative toxin-antitoxin system toxin component, PIN family [Desulfomicrobium apsheronum]|nr:putative toxin-antitoxin system toxin component, PIN family [Desulfomicrobium apsheronum]